MNTVRSPWLAGFAQRGLHVLRALNEHAHIMAIGLGQFHEVGQRVHVAVAVAAEYSISCHWRTMPR